MDPNLVSTVETLNKEASALTVGLLCSIFVPIGFLIVSTLAVMRIIKTKKLLAENPAISSPEEHVPNLSKKELKQKAKENRYLNHVSQRDGTHPYPARSGGIGSDVLHAVEHSSSVRPFLG